MGDTGYAGVPMTEHHNTLLFGGKGQAREGGGHDAFAGVSYDRLDQIRIDEVKREKDLPVPWTRVKDKSAARSCYFRQDARIQRSVFSYVFKGWDFEKCFLFLILNCFRR